MIDWKPWMHDGLVSTEPFANGNMVGYTSQAMALMQRSEHMDWEVHKGMELALRFCWVGTGALTREPGKLINTSFDDYLSRACVTHDDAERILNHGLDHWGFYDVEGHSLFAKKRWKQFLWRSPGFIAHLYFAAGRKPNPFLILAWVVSVFICTLQGKHKQDAWMQTHLMILAYEENRYRSWLCNWVIERFWKKLQPHHMGDIILNYIRNPIHGPSIEWDKHPLVVLWRQA
jgi:hypothetical protein